MARMIAYYYTSHIGRCRKLNQDNFFCNGKRLKDNEQGTDGICSGKISTHENPVFCVFDGMGGEERGELASLLAAEAVESLDFSQGIEQGFQDYCSNTNRSIFQKSAELGISRMGTTAAMMYVAETESGLCNIGDSKIFLLAEGELSQLSVDHLGVSAFGKKPPLLQNLGIPEKEMQIEPYIAVGEFRKGDIYLLCSDGLTDMVPTDRIQQILSEKPGREAAQLLLDEALANGGKDNITFIILYMEQKRFLERVRLWKRKK